MATAGPVAQVSCTHASINRAYNAERPTDSLVPMPTDSRLQLITDESQSPH